MPTLTINFTPANPAPPFGYTVKYREIGSSAWSYATGFFTSPINIPVTGTAYEGTIYAVCSVKCPPTQVCDEIRVSTGLDGASIEFYDCNGNFNGFRVNHASQIILCTQGGLVTDDGANVEFLGSCGDQVQPPPPCEEYTNNSSTTYTGISYTNCLGDVLSDMTIYPGDAICVQPGTGSGSYFSSLVLTGGCGSSGTGKGGVGSGGEGCGDVDIISEEIPWSVSMQSDIGNIKYTMVNVTAGDSAAIYARVKLTFDAYPGAASYSLEYSTDTTYTSAPPAGGWTPYTAQPVSPSNTYLNFFKDNLGPNPGGLTQLSSPYFNEPWIRIKALDASSNVLSESVFRMHTGVSIVPDYEQLAWIEHITDPDPEGETRYDYPGTGIAVGYTYYSSEGGIYNPLFTVTSGDTPETILQKLADALAGPGAIPVTTNRVYIPNTYAVGQIFAHG